MATWQTSGDRYHMGPPPPPVPGTKLTTQLYLVPKSRIQELYLHSPIRLHSKHIPDSTLYTTFATEVQTPVSCVVA
jgi:hypothetical protein